MKDCVIDSSGCIDCPYIPPSDGTPSTILLGANLGWNAGANWHESLDGDFHVVFTMGAVVGAVCGFKSDTSRVGQVPQIEFGFAFYTAGDALMAYPIERGIPVADAFQYYSGDTFEIRRLNGYVTYLTTSAGLAQRQVYRSARRSSSAMLVSACLFSAGDSIG